MLVYANRFELKPVESLDPLLAAIARWLTPRTGIEVTAQSLMSNPRLRGNDGSNIESVWVNDRYPILGSIRFSHPDSEVPGRQWVTDIGVRRTDERSGIECTFLVQTNDISTRVASVPTVTRPQIVRDILQRFVPDDTTPGFYIETLDEHSASSLRVRLLSRDRRSPVVVVSPEPGGEYLLRIDRLQSLLIGLADIAVIPTSADTFKIAEVLGYDYAAWLGGVNVVQPLFRQDELPTFRRLVPDQIVGISDPETEVLSLVTHRMNLPLSWTLVSPSIVEAERRSRSVAVRLSAAKETGEVAEYVRLLESEIESAAARVSSLISAVESGEADVAFWEGQAADLESELRDQKFSNSQLQIALSSVGANESSGAIAAIRENIRRAAVGEPTLEDGLAIVGTIFSDRLTILDSARRSAVNARIFRYGGKAFDLLWLLATTYWDLLVQGNGDVEARKCFGQSYAATESETVSKNSGAMAKRTFPYRGTQVSMTKHLKIGVKDSVVETWRCHFEWVPDEQRIVIGHCGSHLDFH